MQDLGVDILVVFLLLVGVILLTGASLAGAMRATGSGVIDTTRRVRALTDRDHRTSTGARRVQPVRCAEDLLAERVRVSAPEPAPEELIVRATHVEAPAAGGPARSWVDPRRMLSRAVGRCAADRGHTVRTAGSGRRRQELAGRTRRT